MNIPKTNTNSALQHLGILVLRHSSGRSFLCESQIPNWASLLGFSISDKYLSLPDNNDSPLCDFLVDAEACWKSNDSSSKSSRMLSVADSNQKSLLFQATAFNVPGGKQDPLSFLILEEIDQESDLRVVGLQKSREVMLSQEFERQLLEERTLRLKQEQESRKQISALLESVKEKNTELASFATIIAHDLVSPLATLSMHADAFIRQARLENQSSLLEKAITIRNSGERISNFVNSILEYAKMPEEKINKRMLDLEVIVEDVVSSLEKEVQESKTKIKISSLPKILGEEILLSQMFQNLISNAMSHRHPDRNPEISISCEYPNDKKVKILVEDNGQGIEPDEKDRIFGLFEKGSKANNRKSLGIGLATCRKVARLHDAEIDVEGIPGEKSVFSILFPIPYN